MVQKRVVKGAANTKKSSKSGKTTKSTNDESTKMIMCMTPLAVPHNETRNHRIERRNPNGKQGLLHPVSGKRGLDMCDSSNDSGLGFDNHSDYLNRTEQWNWSNESAQAKRLKLDIKVEDEETNDNFTFPETIQSCRTSMSIIRGISSENSTYLKSNGVQNTTSSNPLQTSVKLADAPVTSQPVSLLSQLSNKSNQSDICLRIINQPEQQHRARYQTEGSRGAVKDRTGNGFPVVQLTGYHKPATLEVFIGTDVGKVAPHMFYQACRVSGKNSTPCLEKKSDGTVVIELQLDPVKDMIGTCDCVGILKERNVDVEHRFPEQIGSRSKKKSTRCRMIFRTTITHDNGTEETLQVCSQPIVCTQPPGIPEICKKSLTSCPAAGGLELYILGKNFLKDTKVYFQHLDDHHGLQWEQYVIPDKEYLQQTHLVCVIPPYTRSDITEPVTVRLVVVSSGKTSEPQQFVYTPTSGSVASVTIESQQPNSFMNKVAWSPPSKQDQCIMRPPGTCHIPLPQHRTSITSATEVQSPLHVLKQEVIDENSEHSGIESPVFDKRQLRSSSEASLENSNSLMIDENSLEILHNNNASLDSVGHYSNDNAMEMIIRQNSPNYNTRFVRTEAENRAHELSVMDLRLKLPPVTVADLAYTNAPSMATLRSFGVTESANSPLPTQSAQSVENYLSTIERKLVNVENIQLSQLLNPTCNQITPQSLLTTTDNLSHLSGIHSHLASTNAVCSCNTSQPVQTTNEQMLLQSQNGLNAESEGGMPLGLDNTSHAPCDMLLRNKSQLIGSSQDILVNARPQSPLMVSQTVPNISSEMILNTQLSPSLMCPSTLTQESLLTNMCQSSPQIMISESGGQQTAMPIQLSPVMSAASSEKAILLKAAVDLLETQKKLTELDTLSPTTNALQSMDMMSNMLSAPHSSTSVMPNIGSELQVSLSSGLIASSQLVDNVSVKDITNQIHSEKKNEDRMIPSGFTTMTENELISIINPSCFDQGNNFHSM